MYAKKSQDASEREIERERVSEGEMRSESKITLEQYLDFYEDPWRSNLLRSHLNQIIVMHGFIKLHNFPKGLVQEYLGSIELIPPTRSTLDEDISSGALLTVAEVAEDLAALGWHECTLRSLRTLKPAAELEHFTNGEADLPFIASSSTADQLPRPQPRPRRCRLRRPCRAPPADFVIMGRRPRSKRRCVSINALTAADLFATTSPPTASSIPPQTPPPPSSPPPQTPPPPSSPPPCTPLSTPPMAPPFW